MRNYLSKQIWLTTLILLVSVTTIAQTTDDDPTKIVLSRSKAVSELQTNQFYKILVPPKPRIKVNAYALVDANTGIVIASNNAEKRLPMASLTKIMTAYVVGTYLSRGAIKLSDEVTVSVHAWKQPGSRMFIREGSKVSVSELLYGLIIDSGNDAAVALAEHIAGSEDKFVRIMNSFARQMGLRNTHYNDSTGLTEDVRKQYSTAMDLALLAIRSIYDHPDLYGIYSEKKFSYANITQENRNRLLWQDNSVDGMKTGSFPSSRWDNKNNTLRPSGKSHHGWYAIVNSAKRGDMRIVAATLGAKNKTDRITESYKLINYGFNYFLSKKIYSEGQKVYDLKLWQGIKSEVPVVVKNDTFITIPKGTEHLVKSIIQIKPYALAPIQEGMPLGRMQLLLNDSVIGNIDLVAGETIDRAGFFHRLWDKIKMLFLWIIGS